MTSKPKLPPGTKFEKGTGNKKYKAIFEINGKKKTVQFGHKDYEQYKDSVPKSMGGGKWSHKNHGDKVRREKYQKRHGSKTCKDGTKCIDKKYSAAWFSYHYLW